MLGSNTWIARFFVIQIHMKKFGYPKYFEPFLLLFDETNAREEPVGLDARGVR